MYDSRSLSNRKAENLGIKNALWDKAAKLFVLRDCYNSYFFRVEDPKVNVLDKLMLHGRAFTRYLDGGSACHINLDEHLSKEQYLLLLEAAIKTGCSYFTFNIPIRCAKTVDISANTDLLNVRTVTVRISITRPV